jgi:hypothetical protein
MLPHDTPKFNNLYTTLVFFFLHITILFSIPPKFFIKNDRGPSPNPPFIRPHKVHSTPTKLGSLILIHSQIPLND